MTQEQFVTLLRGLVLKPAVSGALQVLERPPGHRPRTELLTASKWFRSLEPDEQSVLRDIVELAAHAALFGVLAVLDGSRPIGGGGEEGTFRLTFREGGKESELVGASVSPLHELLELEAGSH